MYLEKDITKASSQEVITTIQEITDIPDTYDELKTIPWPAIQKYTKESRKVQAYTDLRNALRNAVDEVVQRNDETYTETYQVPEGDKETLISAWSHSLTGGQKESLNAIVRCIDEEGIWPELKQPTRSTMRDQIDKMSNHMEKGQVPKFELPLLNYESSDHTFVAKSQAPDGTSFKSMEDIAEYILRHQKKWSEEADQRSWRSKLASACCC